MNTPKIPHVIHNWIKYQTFLKAQDNLMADLFTHYQGQKPTNTSERVLMGLLHRYALNFRAILTSWDLFLKDSKIKFPIYTLLRPLIADYLLMVYLLENFKFLVPTGAKDDPDQWNINEDDFVKRYENISATFFKRMDSFLKKKVKNNEMSAEEMLEYLSNHRDTFPEFFQEGAEIKVRKHENLTPAHMASQINTGKQFTKNLYDYYFRLSLFEHFTMATEEEMADPDHNYEMMYIVTITNYLLDALNIMLGIIRAPLNYQERTVELTNRFRTYEWKIDSNKSEATS